MIELLLRSGLVKNPSFRITTITTQGRREEMTFRAWIIKLNPLNKDRILQAIPWSPVAAVMGLAMGISVGILIHLTGESANRVSLTSLELNRCDSEVCWAGLDVRSCDTSWRLELLSRMG